MSYQATNWAWKIKGVTGPEKLILLAIADRHNADTGECYPTLGRIADDTCMSRDTVKRATAAIVEKGIISRSLVSDSSGRVLGYKYHIKIDTGAEITPEGAHSTPPPVHTAPPEGGVQHPKLLKETIKRNKEDIALATRLPDDWQPSDSDIDFAISLDVDYRREADIFRDYWIAQAGAKGRKANWQSTWRNWIRRASERSAVQPARKETAIEMGKRLIRENGYEPHSGNTIDHDHVVSLPRQQS